MTGTPSSRPSSTATPLIPDAEYDDVRYNSPPPSILDTPGSSTAEWVKELTDTDLLVSCDELLRRRRTLDGLLVSGGGV